MGANVVHASSHTPWFSGTPLLPWLETLEPQRANEASLRLPIQRVVRPNAEFRGYAGTVAAGEIRMGDSIKALPSGVTGTVARLVTFDGDVATAQAGDAITVVLHEERDLGRGDVLVSGDSASDMAVTDRLEANLVWTDANPLMPGRRYELRLGTAAVPVTVKRLIHRLNLETLQEEDSLRLDLNDLGRCELTLERAIACDCYADSPRTGGFILVDRLSNATVGAGMITTTEARKVVWYETTVARQVRAKLKGQQPRVLWFTGLSGSGKSTTANAVEQMLVSQGRHTGLLDGDNVRHGLCKDLGFSDEDRVENIRRVGEVAKLMTEAGLIVLVSFISPYRAERQMVRELFAEGEFLEIFVDTPLEICERRDPKGLYRRACQGQIPNFTGISSPYEPPEAPELRLDTSVLSVEQCVLRVLKRLESS